MLPEKPTNEELELELKRLVPGFIEIAGSVEESADLLATMEIQKEVEEDQILVQQIREAGQEANAWYPTDEYHQQLVDVYRRIILRAVGE